MQFPLLSDEEGDVAQRRKNVHDKLVNEVLVELDSGFAGDYCLTVLHHIICRKHYRLFNRVCCTDSWRAASVTLFTRSFRATVIVTSHYLLSQGNLKTNLNLKSGNGMK